MLKTLKRQLRPLLSRKALNFFHKLEAIAANIRYGFPSRRLRVIGVTGTNGKTTTSHLIGAIFEEAGYQTAIASTIAFQIGERRITNALNMTTPNPFVLQRFLKEAADEGAHIAVLETTSHAIDQERIWGIQYEIVVFTNLTHDHLDYHASLAEYRVVKGRLFRHRPRVSVLNLDDPFGSHLLTLPAYQHYTYGVSEKADVVARKIHYEANGSSFTAVTPIGQIALRLHLPGKFNIANSLAAIAVGISQGIGLETIKEALASVHEVPGRMEEVTGGQAFTVLIDYAHTPDAFEKIYETLRTLKRGKIWHVFGATGDRDKTKRPIMGALAAGGADYVVVTSDEPYHEDPERIIDEIVAGVKRGRSHRNIEISKYRNISPAQAGEKDWWWRIPDRREALKFALGEAEAQDVVLVTGMGDLKFMTVSDGKGGIQKMAWNDRAVIEEILRAN